MNTYKLTLTTKDGTLLDFWLVADGHCGQDGEAHNLASTFGPISLCDDIQSAIARYEYDHAGGKR